MKLTKQMCAVLMYKFVTLQFVDKYREWWLVSDSVEYEVIVKSASLILSTAPEISNL